MAVEIVTDDEYARRLRLAAEVTRMCASHGWRVPSLTDLCADEIEGLLEDMRDYVAARYDQETMYARVAEETRDALRKGEA